MEAPVEDVGVKGGRGALRAWGVALTVRLQVASNPLCDLNAPLVSPAFDTRVRAAARKYF